LTLKTEEEFEYADVVVFASSLIYLSSIKSVELSPDHDVAIPRHNMTGLNGTVIGIPFNTVIKPSVLMVTSNSFIK
jgi:hypothetical protein